MENVAVMGNQRVETACDWRSQGNDQTGGFESKQPRAEWLQDPTGYPNRTHARHKFIWEKNTNTFYNQFWGLSGSTCPYDVCVMCLGEEEIHIAVFGWVCGHCSSPIKKYII